MSMRRFSSAIVNRAVRGRPPVRSAAAPTASTSRAAPASRAPAYSSSRAKPAATGAPVTGAASGAASSPSSYESARPASNASRSAPAAASYRAPSPPAPAVEDELLEEPGQDVLRSVPNLARGRSDASPELDDSMVGSLEGMEAVDPDAHESYDDWSTSFQGLGSKPFTENVANILLAPVEPKDVEITPDGLIYLPEIKYRRILNRAFGPGGWGIAPRTKTMVTRKQVTREYGLVALGRLVSVSRGEMDYFSPEGVTTAMEGCKSNALMRCCKDLGIASELWDPAFIRQFKAEHCDSKYFEKKRRFAWKRKDRPWEYPYV